MKKRKGKKERISQLRCPYCGAPAVYRKSGEVYRDGRNDTMLYVCANYPACDSYVRVHEGTDVPVGSLADRRLRKLRRKAHEQFNMLYESGAMSRKDAYRWLADTLSMPMSEAHIGHMGEYYCQLVIDRCREVLSMREQVMEVRRKDCA